MYVVVIAGLALGCDEVDELNPVAGSQVYIIPRTGGAPILVLSPKQMFLLEPAFAAGKRLTVTLTLSILEQVPSMAVSV